MSQDFRLFCGTLWGFYYMSQDFRLFCGTFVGLCGTLWDFFCGTFVGLYGTFV